MNWIFSLLYARHYKPQLVYILPHFQRLFFVFKEVFWENSVLKYGLLSRAASNQERLMMAGIRYINSAPYSCTTEVTILPVFIMHKRDQKATKNSKKFLPPNFRLEAFLPVALCVNFMHLFFYNILCQSLSCLANKIKKVLIYY